MSEYPICFNGTTNVWNRRLVLSLGIPQLTLTIISMAFNSTVIIAVVLSKDLHKPIFILFCNLAISDLLSSSSGFWITTWFLTDPESTVVGSKDILLPYAFYTMSILATIYNLVVIGIERYLAVAECLWVRYSVTRKQTLGIVLVTWLLAFFLGFMPLMGWNCLKKANVSALYSPLCIDYLIFITVPHCAVALILPLFTYVNIIGFLRKQTMTMVALGQAQATYKLAEIQVARTSVFIWLLALLSYAPFFVGVLLDSAHQDCPGDLSRGIYIFRNLTAMMITMNSLGNPIIYTLKMKKLRHRLKFLKSPSSHRIHVQVVGNTQRCLR
ncbi:lysophosphatidic acid receptor 1-like [Eublepharis macularius]|uniref:Lysophosphatidic acid receptor 1-like n=1 Tax=Eublepharis macularius TaxID=481883 RepID=A0AA97LJN4_EUBMA|nr:lysophosphatidic acid receptor 1-like [Eublepharis macularius]